MCESRKWRFCFQDLFFGLVLAPPPPPTSPVWILEKKARVRIFFLLCVPLTHLPHTGFCKAAWEIRRTFRACSGCRGRSAPDSGSSRDPRRLRTQDTACRLRNRTGSTSDTLYALYRHREWAGTDGRAGGRAGEIFDWRAKREKKVPTGLIPWRCAYIYIYMD